MSALTKAVRAAVAAYDEVSDPVQVVELLRQSGAKEVVPLRPDEAQSGQSVQFSVGFRSCLWMGQQFTFSSKQARVVEALWAARRAGLTAVAQSDLLREAESESPRVDHLFRRADGMHPAWGSLIVRVRKGFYGLNLPQG